jgi:hypothetical protein
MRLLELYQDREKLKAMSDAARTHAAELDWQVYKTRTAATVREAIGLA